MSSPNYGSPILDLNYECVLYSHNPWFDLSVGVELIKNILMQEIVY